MTENIPMMDPFAQPFAVDGIPAARPLTRDDLKKIQGALKDFKDALADWERRRERQRAAAEPARQHEEDPGIAEQNSSAGQQAPSAQSEGSQASVSEVQPGRGSGAGSTSAPAATPIPRGGSGNRRSPDAFHCLILAGYLGKGYGSQLDTSTEEVVARACTRHFDADSASAPCGYPEEPRLERIHVILHSAGGSLDSAYKVVLSLRNFAKDIRVYVPRHAKSAATLIAVGADRIVMSPCAELGPLDTQITDPRNPSTHVSALDCYRSVDYVREFGVQTIPRALTAMLDETQALIPLTQLIDLATTFALGSVRPMLESIKGLDFGAWGRTLKIGETYAKALRLRLYHPDPEEAAERIATRLVYGYPHHRYPIDRVEAKSLGLAVDTMPNDVYKAAKAIAAACMGESRFVGFSEDVEDAISQLVEPEEGAPRPVPAVGAWANADGSALGYGPVSPD